MIGLNFTTSFNWIYLFLFIFAQWIIIFIYRKSYKIKGELKRQFAVGLYVLIAGSVGDVIGTSLNLWHFPDGDVPAIIMLIYFFAGLCGYNLIKLIDKHM